MTEISGITTQNIEDAEGYQNLGASYFAARDTARAFMEKFEAEHFKPLIDKFTDQFHERLWDDAREWFLSDTESNLQNSIWRQVDDCVKALLSGERWALERYALSARYEGEAIRAAVAKHIPAELQDMRVVELETTVEELRKEITYLRERDRQ